MIGDDCSDKDLHALIVDEAAAERKKAVAREVLKRRREEERKAWLARHAWVAAVIAAFTAVAGFFIRAK
jgi:hypothetical protein